MGFRVSQQNHSSVTPSIKMFLESDKIKNLNYGGDRRSQTEGPLKNG